ncbi:hypothetical protein F5B20DRAFT_559374 [Whalleya microplaca]|nr:hypothetical protein F5B20DRAFT_559374 [Whalleya microplaca]
MERTHPACDCVEGAIRMDNIIAGYSTPASPSAAPTRVPFDDMLRADQLLRHTWGRIKDCSNASTHQGADLVRIMVETSSRVLSLYEIWTPSLFITVTNGISDSHYDHPSASIDTLSTYVSRPLPDSTTWEGPPVFLGSMRLDDGEAVIVARETLRHAVLRLGEVLDEIQEGSRGEGGHDDSITGDDRVETDATLRDIRSRLSRLLSRMNDGA